MFYLSVLFSLKGRAGEEENKTLSKSQISFTQSLQFKSSPETSLVLKLQTDFRF